jgi:hypothetical protein
MICGSSLLASRGKGKPLFAYAGVGKTGSAWYVGALGTPSGKGTIGLGASSHQQPERSAAW